MKKVNVLFSGIALAGILTFTTPVVAQTDNNTATTTEVDGERDDDDDGDDEWGLLGLLGLVGLLGLKRRDNDNNNRTTVNR